MAIQSQLLNLIKGTDLDEFDHEVLLNANWDRIELEFKYSLINVKWFGAVGDGKKDDTESIRNAAAHCKEHGGILYYPKGSYLSSAVIPPEVTQLYEDGRIIQSNRSNFQFGSLKPSKPTPGIAYWDAVRNALMTFNGTKWTSPLNKDGDDTIDGSLTITGDLTVQGDNVTLSVATLKVADNVITINSEVTGTPTSNSGIEIYRGTSARASIIFNEVGETWKVDQGDGTPKDIVLNEDKKDIKITDATKGLVLTSPDGKTHKLTVDNKGLFGTTKAKVVTELPTADASNRGRIIMIEGGAGVADTTFICKKSAEDTYSWVEF